MKPLLYYALQVIIVSGLLYGYYHLFLRNKKFHHYNRFYLLGATVLSLVVPLLNIPVYFTEADKNNSFVIQTLSAINIPVSANQPGMNISPVQHTNLFTTFDIFLFIYSSFVLLAAVRIVLSVYKLKRILQTNPVQKADNILFINTDEPGTPFSFFRWLFWNRNIEPDSEKGKQIFRHELFHIEQKHSLDVMFMEIVTAFCWFNPFFYIIRKEIKAIHEFLADHFAVTEHTRWEYAELLLMRALDTHQSLVNPFFHNQIKRRIAMITNSKKPGHQYLRKLMVLPVTAVVAALFAFSYRQKSVEKFAAPEQTNPGTVQSDTNRARFPDPLFWVSDEDLKPLKDDTTTLKKFTIASPKRKSPAKEDMKKWVDSKNYGVWIGKHRIKNDELLKYQPSDFVLYYVSKLEKNAVNYGKHYYEVTLLTEKDYVKNFPGDSITYYIKHVSKDTVKPGNPGNNKIFDRVDIDPSFPGGQEKWRLYLERNLNASVPVTNKAPDGAYSVIVQFVVNTDGFISDVQTLTKFGYGMEEEAMRVIKLGPKWLPAIQNGMNVKAYKKQPITFIVGKGDKNYKGTASSGSDALNEVVVVPLQQQTPAQFPGGDEGWKNFLIKNIRSTVPVDSGAHPGQYKAIVQFVVNTDGSLSNFKPVTKYGYGMEGEVTRLLKSGPQWIPAMADGKKVKSYVQQPVTFVITEETGNAGPAKNTAPAVPGISVSEIKSAAPFELLQLTKETEIVSYVFTTDLANGDIGESYNKGNEFSAATKQLIAGIGAGRLITIDQIKILRDGKEVRIPSRVYKVTN